MEFDDSEFDDLVAEMIAECRRINDRCLERLRGVTFSKANVEQCIEDIFRQYQPLYDRLAEQVIERTLQKYQRELNAWVDNLVASPLAADWRKQLADYLEAHSSDYELVDGQLPKLEAIILDKVAAQGNLPPAVEPAPVQSAPAPTQALTAAPGIAKQSDAAPLFDLFGQDALLEKLEMWRRNSHLSMPVPLAFDPNRLDRLHNDPVLDAEWYGPPYPKPKVASVTEAKSMWAAYDADVANGRYAPNFLTRTAVTLGKTLLPPSGPSKIIRLTDGSVYVIMSGGPDSAALAAQAGVISTAATGGVSALGWLAADTATQEATGLPVGPSVVRGFLGVKSTVPTAPVTTRPLPELAVVTPKFVPAGAPLLQKLTDEVIKDLTADISLGAEVLNLKEMCAAAGSRRVAYMHFGNVVHRMVGDRIEKDAMLKSLFRVNRKRGPDFYGRGPLENELFEITTPRGISSHRRRTYGEDIQIITYDRPPNFPNP